MPEIHKYQPGTFCWTELATPNADLAKRFYNELFAWTFHDVPIEGTGVYTICKAGKHDVAALYEQAAEAVARRAPSAWTPYVSVENVRLAARRAEASGGKVRTPPCDVMDAGRMAIIEDPAGASLGLWQPGKRHGAGLGRELRTVDWNELTTKDPAAVKRFYADVFGWRSRTLYDLGMDYTEFRLPQVSTGGMVKATRPGPSEWLPYFLVTDCDWAARISSAIGGKALVPPRDIPSVGRFAVIQDPQGAVFGIICNRLS